MWSRDSARGTGGRVKSNTAVAQSGRELVAIAKTQVQGDLYDSVSMGTHIVQYPRPFLFNLQPMASHPNHSRSTEISRVMCLYDNAGESFLPGQDTASSPATRQRLIRRQVLLAFVLAT